MKKLCIITMALFITSLASAQEAKSPLDAKNEIKFNAGNVLFGVAELAYERIIGDNDMGVGINMAYRILDEPVMYRYYLMPYYRLYFGNKRFCGFVETHVAYLKMDYREYTSGGSAYWDDFVVKQNDFFGMGVSGGFKWISRRGLVGEAYLGLGRTADNKSGGYAQVYPHVGVVLGKRF